LRGAILPDVPATVKQRTGHRPGTPASRSFAYHGSVASRTRWTDERLDDLVAQIRAGIRDIRRELQENRRWLIGMFGTMVLGMVAILIEVAIQG